DLEMGQHAAGTGPWGAPVQFPGVVRDAVLGRLRNRLAVLRCGRAGAALRRPTGWRSADRGCGQAGDADRLLPLGFPHLGDLWPDRAGAGLLRFSTRPAAVDAIGAVSAHR